MSYRFLESGPKKYIFESFLSPGDIVMMTAAIRDLHETYPGEYITDISTSAKDIWQHNPYITKLDPSDPGVEVVKLNYPLINNSNQRPYHFIHGYRKDLERAIGRPIKQGKFKGDIYISSDEKKWMSQVHETVGKPIPYWIIVSGGKNDFTAKWWSHHRWQEVVDHFVGRVQFVQMGEKNHSHPPLKNVIDLVGKTTMRQAIRAIYHADGVLCPVTMFMHMAAAIETKDPKRPHRPCVVVAGGREGSHWEAYPSHQYLHTQGMLSCCKDGGCWKSRITDLGDGDPKSKSLCEKPMLVENGITLPKCLAMIKPEDVIRQVERYLNFE